MNEAATVGAYGELIEPTTLKIQRVLPGPIERVWAYLTDSDLRRKWLASGAMELKVGAPFTLTWRNDELTTPPGHRPEGFSTEHSMESRILVVDPPRRLAYTFGAHGEVTFELEPRSNNRVLLTLTHRRLPDRATMLKVGAGWHAHLDVLVARASGEEPAPFWDTWLALKDDYDHRLP
jgi:uncharacterized protein YndB with AHSA1/START domain